MEPRTVDGGRMDVLWIWNDVPLCTCWGIMYPTSRYKLSLAMQQTAKRNVALITFMAFLLFFYK